MERLTDETQIGPFAALKDKAEAVPGAFGTYDCLYAHMVAVTRLKEYEDTGLGPEDIEALRDREQGLAELLVNVSCGCAVSYTRLEELAQAEKDGRLVVLPVKNGTKVCSIRYNFGNYELVERYYNLAYYGPEEFLVATFKTREEAEAALKEREVDNEAD